MARKTPNSSDAPVNVVGSSTFGRYNKISSEKTYNMFESDSWMINFAGWKRVVEFYSQGVGRGLFHSIRGNCIICVVNSGVFRIDENFGQTFIGNLDSFSGEVYIDENLANQVCIVDGTSAYIYYTNGAPFLSKQLLLDASSNPIAPSYVSYHNSYFLFGNSNTTSQGSNWYIFGYNADTGNSAITVRIAQQLQTKPDYAIAVKRIPGQGNNILVFGTAVCEIWQQVSTVQVYRRNESVNIDYGCLNVATIASCDEYIAWLGVNESNAPVITVFSNQGAEQISTDGINYVLNNLIHPDQSTATFYRQDGHLFYQITFYAPQDNLTLVYDFNTKQFFHLCDSDVNFHPAIDVIYFNQQSYFLSLRNASMYEIGTDLTTYNENLDGGTDQNLISEIPRIRICKSIRHPDASNFVANSLCMMIEQGYDPDYVGLDNLNPSLHYVPRVDLSLSSDGGITWSNTVSREMQPLGIRQNMMTWEKLGTYNDLTMKFKFQGFQHFCVNNSFCEVY